MFKQIDGWLIFGLCGQLFFFMRFFVQWLASEKHKESTIPISFWYFSLGGSLVLLIYSIHLVEPVFILGQSAGFFIYLRNLALIKKSSSVDPAILEGKILKLEIQINELKTQLDLAKKNSLPPLENPI